MNLEGHGREELFEDVDLSRTVGWFTSLYPVLLRSGANDNPGQTLLAVPVYLLFEAGIIMSRLFTKKPEEQEAVET